MWQVKATIIWKFQRNVIGLFCGRHRLRHMLTYLRHFECKTRHDATYKSEHISRLFCEIVNRQSVSVHNDLGIDGVITLWAPLIIYYGTALLYYYVSYNSVCDHVYVKHSLVNKNRIKDGEAYKHQFKTLLILKRTLYLSSSLSKLCENNMDTRVLFQHFLCSNECALH